MILKTACNRRLWLIPLILAVCILLIWYEPEISRYPDRFLLWSGAMPHLPSEPDWNEIIREEIVRKEDADFGLVYRSAAVLKREFEGYTLDEYRVLYRGLRYIHRETTTEGLILDFQDGTGLFFPTDLQEPAEYVELNEDGLPEKLLHRVEAKDLPVVMSEERQIDLSKVTRLRPYLLLLQDNQYAVFIGSMMDTADQINLARNQALQDLGLQGLTGMYAHPYAAVIDRGTVVLDRLEENSFEVSGTLYKDEQDETGMNYTIMSSAFTWDDPAAVIVNGESFGPAIPGMNIVVYDYQSGSIIDRVHFDTYRTMECTR